MCPALSVVHARQLTPLLIWTLFSTHEHRSLGPHDAGYGWQV
jgi:hypothetical protein